MSEKVQATVIITATPQAVFAALTETAALTRWFAEYADISRYDGHYDFWGRYTPEAPDRVAGRHRVIAWKAGHWLSFDWTVRGVSTTVDIKLDAVGDATRVTVDHMGVPARPDGVFSLADFWNQSLENLRSWVEWGVVGTRCDFSNIGQGGVKVSVDVDAPAEAVFETLINPAQLDRYIANGSTVEPRVGGRYDFGWGTGPIKIVDLAPNERLAYAWRYGDEPATVVTWTLEESDGRTRLVLVHSGFGDDIREDYALGWSAFLNQIKFMVEIGSAWQKVTTNEGDYAIA